MKSFLLVGLYSILAAFFFAWESSIFVLINALILELVVLAIGGFLIKKKPLNKHGNISKTGLVFAVFWVTFTCYPAAYFMGSNYAEFSYPEEQMFHAILDFKWTFLCIIPAIGVSYLMDFSQLQREDFGERLTTETFRIAIQLFGISGATVFLLLYVPQTPKWILIVSITCWRLISEIRYMKLKRRDNLV